MTRKERGEKMGNARETEESVGWRMRRRIKDMIDGDGDRREVVGGSEERK